MSRTPIDIEAVKKKSNPIRAIAEHYKLDLGHVYVVADSYLPRNDGRLSVAHKSSFDACRLSLGSAYAHFETAVSSLIAFHVAKYPAA